MKSIIEVKDGHFFPFLISLTWQTQIRTKVEYLNVGLLKLGIMLI